MVNFNKHSFCSSSSSNWNFSGSCQVRRTVSTPECWRVSMRGDEEEDPCFLRLVDEAASLANGGVCHVLWSEFGNLG